MVEKNSSLIRYLVITEKFPPRKGGSNTTFDAVYRRLGDRTTHIVANAQPCDLEFDADSFQAEDDDDKLFTCDRIYYDWSRLFLSGEKQ